MQKYIQYKQALSLKELGMDQELHEGGWYYVTMSDKSQRAFCWVEGEDKPYAHMNPIKAPLYQQAFEWFRNRYKYHSVFDINFKDRWSVIIVKYDELTISNVVKGSGRHYLEDDYDTYELAETAALNELIVKGNYIKRTLHNV